MNLLILFYFCQYIRYCCLEENRKYHLKAVRVETNNLFSTVMNLYFTQKMLFNYFKRIDFIANKIINIHNYLYRIFLMKLAQACAMHKKLNLNDSGNMNIFILSM